MSLTARAERIYTSAVAAPEIFGPENTLENVRAMCRAHLHEVVPEGMTLVAYREDEQPEPGLLHPAAVRVICEGLVVPDKFVAPSA